MRDKSLGIGVQGKGRGSLRCFVCGEPFDEEEVFATAREHERTYSVCSPSCLLGLTTDPRFFDADEETEL